MFEKSTITKQQKIDISDGKLILYPSFFNQQESHQFFEDLCSQINWQHEAIKMFGKTLLQPRLTAYYGNKSYGYSGITMSAQSWSFLLLKIKQKIETITNNKFNGVLLNLYRDGSDYMGWHSDDEKELVKGSIIASLSLGETRRFLLRRKDNHQSKIELNLSSGDVLIMGGDIQTFWQHQIPKTSREVKPRINLTFRLLK